MEKETFMKLWKGILFWILGIFITMVFMIGSMIWSSGSSDETDSSVRGFAHIGTLTQQGPESDEWRLDYRPHRGSTGVSSLSMQRSVDLNFNASSTCIRNEVERTCTESDIEDKNRKNVLIHGVWAEDEDGSYVDVRLLRLRE